MDIRQQEHEYRLEILKAISRSQKALASMAETIAGAYAAGGSDERRIAHELKVLARYQLSLGETILGLKIRNRRFGRPCSPWLGSSVCGCRQVRQRSVRRSGYPSEKPNRQQRNATASPDSEYSN